MIIKIIDSVMCWTNEPSLIKDCLTVTREFWKVDKASGSNRRVRHEYEACLISKDGMFLAGFLPKVIAFCQKKGLHFELEGSFKKLPYKKDLNPPGITLYQDQKKLIQTILDSQRGILQSPTRTGKTVLCYAIISLFENRKSLIICPSKSIMRQTAKEFEEKFKMKVSMVGDGIKDFSGDVVIAIVNSLYKMSEELYHDIFDIVIVDEAHHASSFEGMFFDVLTNILAPVRIGVTATALKDQRSEKSMACEGLIGPISGIFTIAEAVEAKRLVKPKLILLSIPRNNNLKDLRTYGDSYADNTYTPGIYTMGIVRSRIRNNTIANFIKEETNKGKTSIIFVKIIEHANIFYDILTRKGINCEIVNGAVSGKRREELRMLLQDKKLDSIIATTAWKEGINIPSLDIVVNAAGYQDSTPVTQMGGRGLTIFEGKEEGMIVDCLDIGKHLSVHCVERLQTYKELGWL